MSQSFTGPGGDKRVRIGDIRSKQIAEQDEVHATLADLLLGKISIGDASDESPLILAPINLTGLAMIEEQYGSIQGFSEKLVAAGGEEVSMTEVRRITTILVNQDLPKSAWLTEHDVGRRITPDILALVYTAINQVLSPQFAGPSIEQPEPAKPNRARKNRSVGTSSSTHSQSVTATQSRKSGG